MAEPFVGVWDTHFTIVAGGTPQAGTALTVVPQNPLSRVQSRILLLDGMWDVPGLNGVMHGAFDPKTKVWSGDLKWTDIKNSQTLSGKFTLTLGADGKSFTGSYKTGSPSSLDYDWNGKLAGTINIGAV